MISLRSLSFSLISLFLSDLSPISLFLSDLSPISLFLSDLSPISLFLSSWTEAQKYCRENYTDLATIENKEEMDRWVETVARNASTDNVWVGLRHTCALSFWFWVSGEFLCYQNWAPGNGAGVEDCSNGERSGAVQRSRHKVTYNEITLKTN
uniref:C-type lectin domain-containing protein n=1 Tax=Astyanax mexicanus TaxID=7994 RepID=A0A3B1KC04_ASTMX